MSKSKKDKKEKKKQKQLEKIQAENQKFDIIELLENEQLDTKPNFAKFLDQYVEIISAVVSNGKIQFYPTLKYHLPKVLVRFLDGHELSYEKEVLPNCPHFYMYDGIEEVKLNKDQLKYVEMFFNHLHDFGFVHETYDNESKKQEFKKKGNDL